MSAGVTYSVDDENLGWMVFDAPASRANVFDPELQAAFASVIGALERTAPKALILISAKDRVFSAGADLKWLGGLPDASAAEKFARIGQALFQRLAGLLVPVVAAIHGACAGGGFELALACDWRIASDSPATRIGLPEVDLGTLPGWGGCVRLPRLIGALPALDHILAAKLEPAPAALRAGLVDEVVPPAKLRARARMAALQLARHGKPRRLTTAIPEDSFFDELRVRTRGRSDGQPLFFKVIDTIQRGVRLPLAEALDLEARSFGEVTTAVVCKNRVRDFFLRARPN